MKTAYCLRVRPDDLAEWSEPEYFRTRKQRDFSAAECRILGGYRTHSYEERVSEEALLEIEFA
jgi:hypothetical protein